MKSSLIEKFARFTEWENSITGDYFEIGILGESPFHNELKDLAKDTKIKNRPIKIKYLKELSEADACQLIFICKSERKNISKIIDYMKGKNILLIGDMPGYAEQGVHFNFYNKKDNTIHFEINIKALVNSNLKTDMHLLSIGKTIN